MLFYGNSEGNVVEYMYDKLWLGGSKMAGDRRTKTSVQQKFGDEKMRSLEMAISGIEKNFGKGAVMRLGDTQKMNVEVIPTGCLHLDFALGVGG